MQAGQDWRVNTVHNQQVSLCRGHGNTVPANMKAVLTSCKILLPFPDLERTLLWSGVVVAAMPDTLGLQLAAPWGWRRRWPSVWLAEDVLKLVSLPSLLRLSFTDDVLLLLLLAVRKKLELQYMVEQKISRFYVKTTKNNEIAFEDSISEFICGNSFLYTNTLFRYFRIKILVKLYHNTSLYKHITQSYKGCILCYWHLYSAWPNEC